MPRHATPRHANKNIVQIYIHDIHSFKKSLKIRENRIQRHFVYIKTKIKVTTNAAVCPLNDHVTLMFSLNKEPSKMADIVNKSIVMACCSNGIPVTWNSLCFSVCEFPSAFQFAFWSNIRSS